MNTNMNAAPTLPAYDTGTQLTVWCIYCKNWHWHGRGSDGDMPSALGHRWSHCVSDANSPYDQTGYILDYAGLATPEILKDQKRRRPRGPESF